MLMGAVSSEDHEQYVEQVYEKYYATLQWYFLRQFGDASEANSCVQATIRRFFFFMEGRDWEAEEEYIYVYLMSIAGLLCTRKLAEKRARCTNSLGGDAPNRWLDKIRALAAQTINERIQFKQLFLRPDTGGGKLPSAV